MPERCNRCDERGFIHPINPACTTCRGTGHVIGGDMYRACPGCRLFFMRYCEQGVPAYVAELGTSRCLRCNGDPFHTERVAYVPQGA